MYERRRFRCKRRRRVQASVNADVSTTDVGGLTPFHSPFKLRHCMLTSHLHLLLPLVARRPQRSLFSTRSKIGKKGTFSDLHGGDAGSTASGSSSNGIAASGADASNSANSTSGGNSSAGLLLSSVLTAIPGGNLPFSPDYLQVFLTLADTLIELYSRFVLLLSSSSAGARPAMQRSPSRPSLFQQGQGQNQSQGSGGGGGSSAATSSASHHGPTPSVSSLAPSSAAMASSPPSTHASTSGHDEGMGEDEVWGGGGGGGGGVAGAPVVAAMSGAAGEAVSKVDAKVKVSVRARERERERRRG